MHTKSEDRTIVALENQGQKIFGIFHLPLNASSCPVVLMCHGLAGNRTGRARQYVTLSEKLAEMGIASLRIDFRGSGDSEGYLSEMTLHGEVSDALCALKFLGCHRQIDPSRLGIFGRSLGGLVSVLAANRHGGIKSLATWAALYDGHQWQKLRERALHHHISEEEKLGLTTFNGQNPSPAFFEELFSVDVVAELAALDQVPLLNIHGESDAVVTLEHSHRYRAARHRSGHITKFLHLPTAEHEFCSQPIQRLAIEHTCEWFQKSL